MAKSKNTSSQSKNLTNLSIEELMLELEKVEQTVSGGNITISEQLELLKYAKDVYSELNNRLSSTSAEVQEIPLD